MPSTWPYPGVHVQAPPLRRLDRRADPPGRGRRPRRGPCGEALGRSRGGLSSRILCRLDLVSATGSRYGAGAPACSLLMDGIGHSPATVALALSCQSRRLGAPADALNHRVHLVQSPGFLLILALLSGQRDHYGLRKPGKAV